MSISGEYAALHAPSNNENMTALPLQTAELFVIEYDVFRIFHAPPHLEPEMKMKMMDFFYLVW
jgi:hypothetical protein